MVKILSFFSFLSAVICATQARDISFWLTTGCSGTVDSAAANAKTSTCYTSLHGDIRSILFNNNAADDLEQVYYAPGCTGVRDCYKGPYCLSFPGEGDSPNSAEYRGGCSAENKKRGEQPVANATHIPHMLSEDGHLVFLGWLLKTEVGKFDGVPSEPSISQ